VVGRIGERRQRTSFSANCATSQKNCGVGRTGVLSFCTWLVVGLRSLRRNVSAHVPYNRFWDLPSKILLLAPYLPMENPKAGRSYEHGPNYLLAKPCNIHTLLDDLAIVYAKLLPSGASV
jgi:hypothetical protein